MYGCSDDLTTYILMSTVKLSKDGALSNYEKELLVLTLNSISM